MIPTSKSLHIDNILSRPSLMKCKKQIIINNHIVTDSGCWNWTLKTNDRGRAITVVFGRYHNTARVCYIVFNNKPVEELYVCHICDNVLCVNPEHLWLGTTKDNMQDKVAKGRQRDQNGSKHNRAVLTESDVLNIRKLKSEGYKLTELSEMYGVSFQNISAIVTRRKWKHI